MTPYTAFDSVHLINATIGTNHQPGTETTSSIFFVVPPIVTLLQSSAFLLEATCYAVYTYYM